MSEDLSDSLWLALSSKSSQDLQKCVRIITKLEKTLSSGLSYILKVKADSNLLVIGSKNRQ
jgi:hypothetical protein